MDLDHTFNYNNLIELVEIFRTKAKPRGEDEEPVEEKFIEHKSKLFITWEDIKMVQEYPYKEDWAHFKGPKFLLYIHGYTEQKLIYGDYNEMVTYWQAFRNDFPLWIKPQVDDNDERDDD